jgi:hypothetical protein
LYSLGQAWTIVAVWSQNSQGLNVIYEFISAEKLADAPACGEMTLLKALHIFILCKFNPCRKSWNLPQIKEPNTFWTSTIL